MRDSSWAPTSRSPKSLRGTVTRSPGHQPSEGRQWCWEESPWRARDGHGGPVQQGRQTAAGSPDPGPRLGAHFSVLSRCGSNWGNTAPKLSVPSPRTQRCRAPGGESTCPAPCTGEGSPFPAGPPAHRAPGPPSPRAPAGALLPHCGVHPALGEAWLPCWTARPGPALSPSQASPGLGFLPAAVMSLLDSDLQALEQRKGRGEKRAPGAARDRGGAGEEAGS